MSSAIEKIIFIGGAIITVGAIAGGLMCLWEAGREYGIREERKKHR